jgi:hypothetical protein
MFVLESSERARRLVSWLRERRPDPNSSTIFVGKAPIVLADPLGAHWWRSDTEAPGTLHE